LNIPLDEINVWVQSAKRQTSGINRLVDAIDSLPVTSKYSNYETSHQVVIKI
jgi:hypothetical protein